MNINIILFVVTMIAISFGLGLSFRINLTKDIKIKRKVMEISGRLNVSIKAINIFVRCICYIATVVAGSFIIKMIVPNVQLLKLQLDGGIIENIAVFLVVMMAQGGVIFVVWGGISAGIFKINIYRTMDKMNYIKIDNKMKIYTKVIRPLVLPVLECYIFFHLLDEVAGKFRDINNIWFVIFGGIIFTLYKVMIYRTKPARVVIGSWYMCVYVFGVILLGISENYLTLLAYAMASNMLWVYKQ